MFHHFIVGHRGLVLAEPLGMLCRSLFAVAHRCRPVVRRLRAGFELGVARLKPEMLPRASSQGVEQPRARPRSPHVVAWCPPFLPSDYRATAEAPTMRVAGRDAGAYRARHGY